MTWRGVVEATCLTALWLPLSCLAQGKPDAPDSGATVSVHELSIPENARQRFNQGTRLLAAKDWSGSIAKFQAAIGAFPDFYEAYYRMGIAEAELERISEAESAFRKAIELSGSRFAPPYFGLALILCEEQHDFAGAESLARAGLSLNPKNAAGYYTLAWIFYVTDRLEAAERAVQQTLLLQPDMDAARRLFDQIRRRVSAQSASVQEPDTGLRH